MQTLMTALTLAVILGGSTPQEAGAQTPAQLFTKAKLMEVNEGDIEGALALYRRIVADSGAADALKAQALYREGLCLIKKDDYNGARTVFERLIAEHSRTDPAVQAKLMLRSLGAGEKGMAPAKDLTAVVQELLVSGSAGPKPARSALTSLAFYGNAARPVLHGALDQPNEEIRLLALNALAQIGDLDVLPRLLDAAATPEFRRRTSSVPYSPERALRSLCESQEAALSRVAEAYREFAPGLAKANLMRVLGDLDHLDRIGDWKAFLGSENAEMREAAWDAYARKAGRDSADAAAFLEDLLRQWEARPSWRMELSEHLFSTGRRAAQNDPALVERWNAALLAAARSEDPKIVKKVVDGFRRFDDFGAHFEVRTVLLGSPDPEVREEAAYLRFMKKGSQPDMNVDQSKLHDFVNALLQAARTHAARDANHAGKLLRHLEEGAVPLLDPVTYAALVDRLFSEPLMSSLYTETQIGRSDATTGSLIKVVAILDIEGAFRRSDKRWPIAEKYLPVLLRYAGAKAPANLRLNVLHSLSRIIRGSWKFLSDADRMRMKEVLIAGNEEIAGGRVPMDVARQLVGRIYESLVLLAQQQPRLLTVEDVLTRIPFGPAPGESNVASSTFEYQIFRCFSPEELKRGFQAVAERQDLPVQVLPLLFQLMGEEMPAEERDAALRALWPRASVDVQYDIVGRLAQTPKNLEFLTAVITPDLGPRLANSIVNRFAAWSDRETVPGLLRLLETRDCSTMLVACRALGSLADPRAIPKLIELLAYPEGTVRKQAEEALTAIRNIDKKQAEWQEWYEQLKKEAGKKM